MRITASAERIMKALEPALIGHNDQSDWPGTRLIGHSARVFRYRYNAEVCMILGSSAHGLYDWVTPDRPEDLSVLTSATPILTTIAHERDGYLDLSVEQVEKLSDLNPGLKLFRGNIMPRSAEPYRLFGAFLDERSLGISGSIKAALAEYLATASADKREEVVATIRDVLRSHGDGGLLRLILQRWGAAPALTEASYVSRILTEIVADLARYEGTSNRSN